jgi:hypothetical protein
LLLPNKTPTLGRGCWRGFANFSTPQSKSGSVPTLSFGVCAGGWPGVANVSVQAGPGARAMARTLNERIDEAATRLAQLNARARLLAQAEKARARRLERRQRARTLSQLLRSEDAHRKIVLGGVVIAAGADSLDPAELCGWLLHLMAQRVSDPNAAAAMKEAGIRCFAARSAPRPDT